MSKVLSIRLTESKMTLCDYRILEHTTSEVRKYGTPFVVVLLLHTPDSYTLAGYVLRDWQTKIEATSKHDLGDIEFFLKDLRGHSKKQDDVASFFNGLDGLGVGPIRAFVSGSCLTEDLDVVIQTFFDETRGAAFWKEHFDNLNEGALIERYDLAKPAIG
jgi:hypothetical protein